MKIACCKFAGLANGGTEKYLQTLAILYKEAGHEVDYYYTNAAPILNNSWQHPENDDNRKSLLISSGIKVIPIYVESRLKNDWINSNFTAVFDQSSYDMLITAGNGEAEFPYNILDDIPIIHTVHGFHAYNKPNIRYSVLLCEWQADKWLLNGGDKDKLRVIPPLVYVPDVSYDLREDLGIPSDSLVFGLHQRDGVGNTIPLESFVKANIDGAYFLILGGSEVHKRYEHEFIKILPPSSSPEFINAFLNTLDIYAHSRIDGEVCSASIIEAMAHGLPLISHIGSGPNYGHLEQLSGCGIIASSEQDYVTEMRRLTETEYYNKRCTQVKAKYKNYAYNEVKQAYINLLD